MGLPPSLKCLKELATRWPVLLEASGIEVRVAEDGLSGTATWMSKSTPVVFKEYDAGPAERFIARGDGDSTCAAELRSRGETFVQCSLGEIRIPYVIEKLTKSFLASGATCTYEPFELRYTVALLACPHSWNLERYNQLLAGLAELRPVPSDVPLQRFPSGGVVGAPTSLAFEFGLACAQSEDKYCHYLEMHETRFSKGFRTPSALQTFVSAVSMKLKEAGGARISVEFNS